MERKFLEDMGIEKENINKILDQNMAEIGALNARIKTKDTESIALGMYLMQVLGIALWLAHGLVIQDLPLILANSVSFILSGTILVYKIRYK